MNTGTIATSNTATQPKKDRVRLMDFSTEVEKARISRYNGAVKEEGKRGEDGYKQGRKASVESSKHGELSFTAMLIQAEKMHKDGRISIVKIEKSGKYCGQDAYGIHTVEHFDEMADGIHAYQDSKRAAKNAEQKPEDGASRLQGRITSFYRELNGYDKPGSEREKGLIEMGQEHNWGYDFTPVLTELKEISDRADLMSVNRETTTREAVQAEHKKLTDLQKRLESDLVINKVDRLVKLIDDAGKNGMGNGVVKGLRDQALAISTEYTNGNLTGDAAQRKAGDLFGMVIPLARKAKASAAPPRRDDARKPGSTATMREVSDRNRSRRSR